MIYINNKINSQFNTNMKRSRDVGLVEQMGNLGINSNETINALIYTRCSTKKQNEDGLHSNISQLEACRNYATGRGFTVTHEFSDIMPGHDINKIAIASILKDDLNIDVIIVKDPSRISRRPEQGIKFVMDCLKDGIIIHSVSDDIDTGTNNELKLFNSLFFDAYAESQQISKRIRTTFEIKKLNGGKLGMAPYGKKFVQITTDSGLPIQKSKKNKSETRIIDFIVLLYYGGNLTRINNTLYKILEKKDLTLEQRQTLSKSEKKRIVYSKYDQKGIYWVDDKTDTKYTYTTDILYGYNTQAFISQILNNFNILKKNKPWTTSGIASVIKNYNKKINPMCLTSDGEHHLYDSDNSNDDSDDINDDSDNVIECD
jgi:DNA invertase Pin-like site-specific DNA recombinase